MVIIVCPCQDSINIYVPSSRMNHISRRLLMLPYNQSFDMPEEYILPLILKWHYYKLCTCSIWCPLPSPDVQWGSLQVKATFHSHYVVTTIIHEYWTMTKSNLQSYVKHPQITTDSPSIGTDLVLPWSYVVSCLAIPCSVIKHSKRKRLSSGQCFLLFDGVHSLHSSLPLHVINESANAWTSDIYRFAT